MWSFWFGLLFIHDSSSIKVAPLLYYTSVLISTKITTIFSLWDPYWNLSERSYEIEGPRLSAGATHKLKPSPSTWPESQNICIPLRSTSYVPYSTSDSCVDQFLTGGQSTEYWENRDVGNWVSLISGVAIDDDEWWMIDDGLSVAGLAVMRLWGDGKSKGYLMLAELELDTCQDRHPCSSVGERSLCMSPLQHWRGVSWSVYFTCLPFNKTSKEVCPTVWESVFLKKQFKKK